MVALTCFPASTPQPLPFPVMYVCAWRGMAALPQEGRMDGTGRCGYYLVAWLQQESELLKAGHNFLQPVGRHKLSGG